jgi:nicotinate phosphoribosyltransferase
MLLDFYELTMANGYYVKGMKDVSVVFDMFYRKNPDDGGFVICAGLEQVIAYISNMSFSRQDIEYLKRRNLFDKGFLDYLRDFRFRGSIDAVPEGTIVYPNTPILTVTAPIIDAQLVETMILLTINHQSLIATKANRITRAAGDAVVMEFGARRAQGPDAAELGSRAAYIGGADATATTSAEELYGIPAVGTMAHSWVQFFQTEYDAFKAYAEVYPDSCTLLIDTYDVLESGLENAIRVAGDVLAPMGKRLKGIRIDSGDLAYLSKKARKRLDEAGLSDCKIVVSNSIDEYLIRSLNAQHARIDSYGIGERLITAKSDPIMGGVYKLVAVYENGVYSPRIKVSENIEKITNPGKKKLWRIFDLQGIGIADFLTLYDEEIDMTQPLVIVDTAKPWKRITLRDYTARSMQEAIFRDGELVYNAPSLKEIRKHVEEQLEKEVWEEEKRFENPHIHYLDFSEKLYELKESMLNQYSLKKGERMSGATFPRG